MTVAAPALYGVKTCGVRGFPRGAYRRFVGGAALGLGAVAGAGVVATLAAAWLVSGVVSSNPNVQARATYGPRTLAHYRPPVRTADGPAPARLAIDAPGAADVSFETRWARATVPPAPSAPPQVKSKVAKVRGIKLAALTPAAAIVAVPPKLAPKPAQSVPLPRSRPAVHDTVRAPATGPAAKAASAAPKSAKSVPVPPSRPAIHDVARAPATEPAAKVASAAPPETTGSIPRDPVEPAHNKVTRPTPGSRIAVYDISARTVYMPNGEKLEAHSGLGERMDDPRHIRVRMRGPTPPNVYDLTWRERLFHGVRAIRLNPVNEDKMFGRDGMLAHTYMLGTNGQSNGCVSFKNYAAFQRAFERGEVERLIVVASLGDTMPDIGNAPTRTARAPAPRRWRLAESRKTVAMHGPSNSDW